MVINFEPCDLEFQKIKESFECSVTLAQIYIKIKYDFYSTEPVSADDISLGWQDSRTDYEVVIFKSEITAVEKVYMNKESCWAVFIFCNGNVFNIYVKKAKVASEIYSEIIKNICENTFQISQ